MKVLMPHSRDANPFFDGIVRHSKHSFCNASLMADPQGYSIILIHWPEILFNWKEPTEEQLSQLESQFAVWKEHTKVVYVVHNLKRHSGMTPNFKSLYQIVLENCDAMVHLGQYSLELYKRKYPAVTHKYIPHPLYGSEFTKIDKNKARAQLGVSNKKTIVLVPGSIRVLQERKMIEKAFNAVRANNKMLVVPNMYRKRLSVEFKGRHRLKKYIDVKKIAEYFYNKEYASNYHFNYGFIDFYELSLWLSAADVLFIPRINSLNSGNVFLGLTFKKVIVGPEIGNIAEFLQYFNLPTFNPENKASVSEALHKAVELSTTNELPYKNSQVNKFHPKVIALKWDDFLEELVGAAI